MISQIPYNESQYKTISELIKRKEKEAGGKDKLPHKKLKIRGIVENLPYYNFRTDEVYFNKANGRIKSEVLEKEAQLGRELNEINTEDQTILRELLLDINPDENEKLKEDLIVNEQFEPGIMTCDGILINGNRRKAIFEKLLSNEYEKFRYIDVHILPPDIKKDELWLIEAGIQLSSTQQLNYSPINDLLKIKEGIDAGLDIEIMASRIYGMSKEKLERDVGRLNLINEYLSLYLEKPGKYYLVKNLAEHFIDLQNIYDWANNPRGRVPRDWTPDGSDIEELKVIGFAYIRAKFTHMRIRELRNLFVNKISWRDLKKTIKISNKLNEKDLDEVATEPIEDIYNDNDNDVEVDLYKLNPSEKKDFAEERIWIRKNILQLKTNFENAKEQLEIKKNAEQPLTLANRALINLKGVPRDKDKLNDPKLDSAFKEIIEVTNRLRKIIKKKR
ncbi:MAG: hypothetical protein IIA48_05700 [Bacteroidetes bacterium]|nr:hypothetical protein [Bacteroidota bacterium]